jgi:hypothetical protein
MLGNRDVLAWRTCELLLHSLLMRVLSILVVDTTTDRSIVQYRFSHA